ncbi:MAG: tetratricopeptide repeat protein [Longimicrobiales bacterium]
MAESNREEIAKLEAIYANNPGGRVFTHLAEAYRKAGELERARSILEAGVQRHPDYASAHVVIGRVFMDQGALAEAAQSFQRVLELDPENRVALRTMGDLARAEHPREALIHYRQLQSLDPSDEELAELVEQLETLVRGVPPELTQEPTPQETPAEAPSPEPSPSPAPIAQAEVPAAVSEVPSATAAPNAEEIRAPEPAVQNVGPDYTLDWTAAEPEQADELPGDLEELARETALPEAAAAAEPEHREAEVIEPPAREVFIEAPSVPDVVSEPPSFPSTQMPDEMRIGQATEDALSPPSSSPSAPDTESSEPDFIFEPMDLGTDPIELAAAPEAETTFEELLTSNLGSSSPLTEIPASQPDLPTETLAELYWTQGFYERSAEVYRALLKRRPDDRRLRERLDEVESLESSVDADPVSGLSLVLDEHAPVDLDESPAEPPKAGGNEAWMEGIESAWTGGAGAADVDESPYAWELESEDDAGGPTLRSYLGEILAWRPTVTEFPAVSEDSALPDAAWDAELATVEPHTASSFTEESELEAAEDEVNIWGDEPLPWEEPTSAPGADSELQAWSPAEENTTPVVPALDDIGSLTTDYVTPPASGNGVEDAFEEWFSGSEPEPAGPTEPVAQVEQTEEMVAQTETDVPTSGDDDSDDDLEMFRSWLQSLKR